jgi:hypothetical protein
VPGVGRLPSWSAWVLCWIALALQITGLSLRIALPETVDDELFYAFSGVLGAVLLPLVGAIIAARVPANPCGWLLCALGSLYGVVSLSDGIRRAGLVAPWVTWLVFGTGFAMIQCLIVLLLLLFPTGRLPGPAWRWPARAAVALEAGVVLGLPFAPSLDDIAAPSPAAVQGRAGAVLVDLIGGALRIWLLLVTLAAVSVLVRFRRAGRVERQQLKWFLLAVGLAAVSILVGQLSGPVRPPLWAFVDAVSFALLPIAVGIAVLRYRLYEIDRIISRSVSYGLLTSGLIALYFVVVTVLRPLLEPLTGSSALAVAASTLAVAAVFNPARRRLQAAVDRRFDRARYDAARAVDAFAARLRTQVDLDEVVAGLRGTVVATVAPARVSVWLRDTPTAEQA